MKRRRALVALVVAFALTCARPERHHARYNVLLITLDTFRADRLGVRTPNLSALAKSGVQFARVSSPVPLTLPAHASILSSSLPLHHGLRNNGAGVFPGDRETLATLFAHVGYRTGAFVSSFVLDHRFGLNRGFETYDDEVTRDPNANSSYDAERRGGDTVDRAVAWLRHADARPSFAWVHLYDAHAPYAPPAPYPQTYDGEIEYVDAQVGRLLAAVDRRNTVIAIIGDHGESLGEHGELTHGLLLYEPTLHVPLVIAAPDTKPHVINEAASSIDLAPTLAALAGTPFGAKTDGRDLSASITGTNEPPAAELYAESEYPALFGWSELAALRRGNLKYIASPAPELYDLARDPGETHNVLSDERRAYRDLSTKLTALRDLAKAAAPKAQPSPLDDEAKAKLASLGYVAPTSLVDRGNGPRPTPASMAPLFRTFEEATWATNQGRLDDAIRMLAPIVARDPRNPVFRSTLARALRQKGDARGAIKLNQEAVALAPDDAEAWYNLGVAFQEAGLTKEGLVAMREALARDPRRPEAHNALGISYMSMGEWAEAKAEFRKALGLDPRDARAYNNLGNVDRAAGALDAAAASYAKALAVSPNYADALNGLGVIEVQRDDPRAALGHFDKALQLAPHFYEAQLNRGIALQLLGDKPRAAEQFRALLAELPPGAQFDAQRNAATQLLSTLNRS